MAKTTEQLVEELADREVIRDLPKRPVTMISTHCPELGQA